MEEMEIITKPKILQWYPKVLFIEFVVIAIIYSIGIENLITYQEVITFPMLQIAEGLRYMSLHNSIGNSIAIILYILLSIAPLIYIYWRKRKKQGEKADILLGIFSILLCITIYLYINPGYIRIFMGRNGMIEMGKLALGSSLYAVFISYIVMRLLTNFTKSDISKSLATINIILYIVAMISALNLAYSIPKEVMTEMIRIQEINTMPGVDLTKTNILIVLEGIGKGIPIFFGIWILYKAIALVEELKVDRYTKKVVKIIEEIARLCKNTISITIIYTVGLHVVQLIVAKHLVQMNYTISIPIGSMLVVIVIMLFAKYFAESIEIKNENDLFV